MDDFLQKLKTTLLSIIKFIKDNKYYFIFSMLAFILLFGIFLGKSQNSKEDTLKNLEIALKNNDKDKLEDLISMDKFKVDTTNLYHLLDYYNEDSLRVDSTISKLKQNGETQDFKIETEEGTFGEKCKLYINVYNIKINSNYEEGTFTIDEESISSGATFVHLVPGIYDIKGTLNSDYGDINNDKNILLMQDEEVNLNFDAMNIKVKSEYSDASILLNDKDIGITVRDDKEIGPVSKDGSVKVSIEREFPWGKIKSNEVKVSNSKEINLSINMENDELRDKISSATDGFYRSVFKALNDESKSSIEDASEETKNKIYTILEKNYILFKNDYEIKEVSIQEGKSEYSYVNNTYCATVAVDLKYNVHSLFGLVSNDYEKKFFTKLQYVNNNWIVVDVENFSL